ncbi:hypothetical protein Hanom_Chr12g01145581 [Helianthus anomalus]
MSPVTAKMSSNASNRYEKSHVTPPPSSRTGGAISVRSEMSLSSGSRRSVTPNSRSYTRQNDDDVAILYRGYGGNGCVSGGSSELDGGGGR